jgi:ubiquinone/menaquinone biosynthesis C-methylase UbiE
MEPRAQRIGRFAHPGRNAAAIGVEAGHLIADFGAGSGHYTLHFAELLQGTGRVYAIDVQPNLLRRIRNDAQHWGFKNVEAIVGDVERAGGSGLSDNLVDLVLMSNILFQLENKSSAFLEAWRILKPTGSLALIEWADASSGDGQGPARMGPARKHVVGKELAVSLAKESGFTLAREFQTGTHHYGLLLKPIPQVRL